VEPEPQPDRSILALLGLDPRSEPGLTTPLSSLAGEAPLTSWIEEQLRRLGQSSLDLGLQGSRNPAGIPPDAVGRTLRQLFEELEANGGQPQASLEEAPPAIRPQLARILEAAEDTLDAPLLPASSFVLAADE
jgi:hypothetical protein